MKPDRQFIANFATATIEHMGDQVGRILYIPAAGTFKIHMSSWGVRLVLQAIWLFLLLGIALPVWCQTTDPGTVLTIEQAVRLTEENNRHIKNAELEVGRSQDRLVRERTNLFPTYRITAYGAQLLSPLDFSFSRANVGGTTTSGPFTVYNQRVHNGLVPALYVNARINQPLSQLPRTQLKIRQFALAEASAREQVRLRRQELVSEVKKAYYGALEKESALAVAEETVKLYEEIERVTQQYVAQRMVLPAESIAVKRRLASAKHELLCVRDSLASQKERINQLLGRDIDVQFTLEAVPPALPVEFNLAAARARALSTRAELRLVQNERKQAEFAQRIIRQKFVPDLSLNVDYLSFFGLQLLPKNVVAVGLWLSWEPWDMGRKLRELSEQSKTVKESQNNLRELEGQIALDINDCFRRLRQARELLQVTELGQEEARQQLRVIMDRYKIQATMLKDVLQSETALVQANHEYQRSLLSFWSAKADFEKAIGED